MRFAHALVLGLGLSGCSVATLKDTSVESTRNQCSANADCGSGVCKSGQCQASAGSFSTLLLEVTPPADDDTISSVRFLKQIDGLSLSGGRQDLTLDRVAHITGYVLPARPDQSCSFANTTGQGSVPARVTFTPTRRFLGLSLAHYAAATRLQPVTFSSSTSQEHAFELNVPAGEYDVYVQGQDGTAAATSTLGSTCPLVPKLIRRVRVDPGIVKMPLSLGSPSRLELTIKWPGPSGTRSLDGWTVDIIEPASGQVISTNTKLGEPFFGSYDAMLYYWPIADPAQAGRELVRLSPGSTEDAPTILLERASLELFDKGQGIIDQLDVLPEAVTFDARVERSSTSVPVAATVSLIATSIDSLEPGTLASFRRDVQTDSMGRFHVKLLPGKYRVIAVPSIVSGAAATETTLEVAAAPAYQAGQVIEVPPLTRIDGTVRGPTKTFIAGASVHASATASSTNASLLDEALGAGPFIPRVSSCTAHTDSCTPVTDAGGHFTIDADPGLFDLSVRPPDSSGFAWLVRPNISVQNQALNLGTLSMPLPVAYSGTVSSAESGPIAGALIRAYVFVGPNGYATDPGVADSLHPAAVLQVAESRASEDGTFELRVPAHLDQGTQEQ